MKSVAIVGFAESTLAPAKDSKADEMWSLNFAWSYDIPRIDRLFEMHPIWFLDACANSDHDAEHLEWLQKKHPFPIYMQGDYSKAHEYDGYLKTDPLRIPSCVPYPLEEVYKLFNNFKRMGKSKPYLTSSICYMIALAIVEGFEKIELYGMQMAIGTEYFYQKPGAEMIIGLGMGLGIEFHTPENCTILNSKLYHEGAQMINRQTLELHAEKYRIERDAALGARNLLSGKIQALLDSGKTSNDKEVKVLMLRMQTHERVSYICDGAIQANENSIKSIDFEDPKIEIKDRYSMKDIKESQDGRKKRKRKRKKAS